MHCLTSTMSLSQTCVKVLFLLIISPFACIVGPSSTSSNTLKQGDILNFHQALRSPNSEFSLSFSNVVTDHDNRYYLGIFHINSGMLWVAQRENPILDASGSLTIDVDGTLMIKHGAGNPIVLYSDDETGGAGGGTRVATLHNNGNFIFSELDSDGSIEKILWQSFQYPTDTLLAGMVLGAIDHRRGPRLSLTSWLTRKDPSSGAFSLEWDHVGLQMVVKRRGDIVWKSGMMKDGIFPYIPRDFLENCIPIVNGDGNSLSCSANNTVYWRLSAEGSLSFQNYNQASDESYFGTIEIMNMCYGYNNDNGCVTWLQPKCRNDRTTFISQRGFLVRVDSNEIDLGVHYVNASAGPGDCRAMCWEDCDCLAYDAVDDVGCQFWKGKSKLKLVESYITSSLNVISTAAVASQSPTHQPHTSSEGHVHGGNDKAKPKPGRKWWMWTMVSLASMAMPDLLL